jgi:hypothetical protein
VDRDGGVIDPRDLPGHVARSRTDERDVVPLFELHGSKFDLCPMAWPTRGRRLFVDEEDRE